ncbi:MAG TPA: EpsI family protein [Pyrinomonadaceae bacterium]|nr:EpsI family protein [Pyrinomonadaceae bacterium]
MRAGQKRFWVVVALILAGGALVNFWELSGEARIERRPLKEFPAELGGWHRLRPDAKFDAATEAVLKADDYVLRDYGRDGAMASLYVGYYATQRTGATYHSPLNCMPGTGWTLSTPATVTVRPEDGSAAFEANRYVVQNASEKYMLVYWYQGRGRAVASEYTDKLYVVMDSLRRRRSDGSMVRLLVPVRGSEAEAERVALDVAARVSPRLSEFVPN